MVWAVPGGLLSLIVLVLVVAFLRTGRPRGRRFEPMATRGGEYPDGLELDPRDRDDEEEDNTVVTVLLVFVAVPLVALILASPFWRPIGISIAALAGGAILLWRRMNRLHP